METKESWGGNGIRNGARKKRGVNNMHFATISNYSFVSYFGKEYK